MTEWIDTKTGQEHTIKEKGIIIYCLRRLRLNPFDISNRDINIAKKKRYLQAFAFSCKSYGSRIRVNKFAIHTSQFETPTRDGVYVQMLPGTRNNHPADLSILAP
jgi:hypothetical protein